MHEERDSGLPSDAGPARSSLPLSFPHPCPLGGHCVVPGHVGHTPPGAQQAVAPSAAGGWGTCAGGGGPLLWLGEDRSGSLEKYVLW